MKRLRWLGWLLIALALLLAAAWTLGALHYDAPAKWIAPAAAAFIPAVLLLVKPCSRKFTVLAIGFATVLLWWFGLQPSNEGRWQPDVAQLGYAEIKGDQVVLHNVRHCDYRTETDYTARWETRTVRLSQITGIDIAINYWGSPWMAHPILSFQFADTAPVCFSIETRKQVGQSYSAIGGLYRQFGLIYIMADERDVVRVRTNYREGESVYLYHMSVTPEQARERFVEYLRTLNRMRDVPRWYNAITTNCTTSIREQRPPGQRTPWDWRILANGKGDELMYERQMIATGGLPFAELKRRSLINDTAKAAGDAPDFSARIRAGLPGFSPTASR